MLPAIFSAKNGKHLTSITLSLKIVQFREKQKRFNTTHLLLSACVSYMKVCEDVTVLHNINSSVYILCVCVLYDFTRLLDLIVPLLHLRIWRRKALLPADRISNVEMLSGNENDINSSNFQNCMSHSLCIFLRMNRSI